MKTLKLTLVILAACLITIGLSGMAEAFHSGGVAHCDGCHSMHNSPDNPISGAANTQLKKGSDASSTCLNCHKGAAGSYRVASPDGGNLKNGGDFFWVQKDFTYPGRSGESTSSKFEHGHNIVSIDYPEFVADTGTAPGGTYAAANLGCASCHDPHGKVMGGTKGGSDPISGSGSYGGTAAPGTILGNYRLLGSVGFVPTGAALGFTNPAPIARSNSAHTKADYGSGMSEWCSNCHAYANQTTKHVSGAITGVLDGQSDNYNAYVATGNWVPGNKANAYDALVPFERGIADGSLLDENSTVGPDTDDNVMCLTCHRAHGTAHQNAGRWDFKEEFLAESLSLISSGSGALTATEKANSYYKNGATIDIATEYGEFQRSLCNKCHAQD